MTGVGQFTASLVTFRVGRVRHIQMLVQLRGGGAHVVVCLSRAKAFVCMLMCVWFVCTHRGMVVAWLRAKGSHDGCSFERKGSHDAVIGCCLWCERICLVDLRCPNLLINLVITIICTPDNKFAPYIHKYYSNCLVGHPPQKLFLSRPDIRFRM